MPDITKLSPPQQRAYLASLKPTERAQAAEQHAETAYQESSWNGYADQVAGVAIDGYRIGSDIVTFGASETLMSAGQDIHNGNYGMAAAKTALAGGQVFVAAATWGAAGLTRPAAVEGEEPPPPAEEAPPEPPAGSGRDLSRATGVNPWDESVAEKRREAGFGEDGRLLTQESRPSTAPAPTRPAAVARPSAEPESAPVRPPRGTAVVEYKPGPDARPAVRAPRPSQVANPGGVHNLEQLRHNVPGSNEPTHTLDIRG
ncbi:MAG: hypothetical protein ACYCW6_03440 [Candidatus Xenobia bacterium]